MQEYAQKVGIPTPVYQTLKEGPSHEPVFKSSVIVNDVKYESLPGFFNRKAAEQSAAEVALMEIHKSGQMTESIPIPVSFIICYHIVNELLKMVNFLSKIKSMFKATLTVFCMISSKICRHGDDTCIPI